jgi:hypothetical protein
MPLTKAGRKLVAAHLRSKGRRTLPAHLSFTDSGRPTLFELTRPVHF